MYNFNRKQLYRCRLEDLYNRQIGELAPRAFAHRIGGCEDVVRRLEHYAELCGHDGCVNTVHFNPTGEILVSGSDDTDIIFWDWAAKSKKLTFNSGHENNVFQARIMPLTDNRSVVTCAADGQVRHAEISEGGKVRTVKLAKHRGRAHKLAIEPGSPRIFFSCGEDGVVRHFDLRENKQSRLFTCYGIGANKRNTNLLNTIAINPHNPNYFAIGGSDVYARVYDIRKVFETNAGIPVDLYSPTHLLTSSTVHITCIAYSHQEEMLVSYNDELIYLFEKDMGLGTDPTPTDEENANEDGKKPEVYKGHRNSETVKGVNFFGPNDEYVVSGSDCGHVFIWKKRGGQLVSLLKGDNQVVNCLEPHPSITVLATSGIDHTVKIWAPTAENVKHLSHNATKIMETNRISREEKLTAPAIPDMLLRILHRRHMRELSRSSQIDAEVVFRRNDMENDEESEDENDDDDRAGNGECVIT